MGSVFFASHAWGASGDDSPAYIEMAARYSDGRRLVYTDPVVAALEDAGQPDQAQAATPHYHYMRLGDGLVAPRTQVGTSAAMATFAAFTPSGPFLLHPFLGVVGILALHALGSAIFAGLRWGDWVSAMATILGTSSGYYRLMATYQPMTEMVAFVFVVMAFWLVLHRDLHLGARVGLAALAGGAAVAARTSSGLAAPFVLALALFDVWALPKSSRLRRGAVILGVAAVAGLVGYATAVSVVGDIALRTGHFALVPNEDHVGGLSTGSFTDNTGKYVTGAGGLETYWKRMDSAALGVPGLGLLFLAGGLALLLVRLRAGAALGLFGLTNYLFYAAWTNPYERYIQPIVPLTVFVGVAGAFCAAFVQPRRWPRALGVVVVLCAIVALAASGAFAGAWHVPEANAPPPGRGLSEADWQAMSGLSVPDGAVVVLLGTAIVPAATFAGVSHEHVIKVTKMTSQETREEFDVLAEAGLVTFALYRAADRSTWETALGQRLGPAEATLEVKATAFELAAVRTA